VQITHNVHNDLITVQAAASASTHCTAFKPLELTAALSYEMEV
jgi:hypothetical protein